MKTLVQGPIRTMTLAIGIAVALVVLGLIWSSTPVSAVGGPVVLMGIDAEDGNGAGSGHGGKTPYIDIVDDILNNVSNGGSGILVIGGGKNASDNVTSFWNAVGAGATPSQTVTHVNGATNITNQSFAGFAIIAVASAQPQTPGGGLTNAENSAIAARSPDIAAHVNGGGGVFGLSQRGLTNPNYVYLGGLDGFSFAFPSQYQNVTATVEGLAVGITNTNLDICCWHDEYLTFPSFLGVLATNNNTGNAAAIGGASVIVQGTIDLAPTTDTNSVGQSHTVTATAEDGSPLVPAVGVTVTFEVTAGPNIGEVSDPNTGECAANNDCTTDANGQVSWTYTGSGGPGTDTISASFVDQSSNTQTSNPVEKIWEPVVTPTPGTVTPTVGPSPVGGIVELGILSGSPADASESSRHDYTALIAALAAGAVVALAASSWYARRRWFGQ